MQSLRLHKQKQKNRQRTSTIMVVTGYSGAGKSTVLHTLEDIGFFCVDNLPSGLLDSFFQLVALSEYNERKVALGIDVRGGSVEQLVIELDKARRTWGISCNVFFLRADATTLLKRFQETRRKHPLANGIDLRDAIEQEQRLLKPLSDIADSMLDTGQLTIHQLRSLVRETFSLSADRRLLVSVTSFGFKYGVPPECNFIYDIRSLPNPYFVPELKMLSGMDMAVSDYLFSQQSVQKYWEKLVDFVRYSIKASHQEGRAFLSIAVGCTGGRHRSVVFAQRLAQQKLPYVYFVVKHRDIDRDCYVVRE